MKKEVKPIILDTEACYAALASHDARFDGRFFIGVSSTGIYCRPVCRVKLPKKENCLFFANAASAEAEGFRPCLKCRPELAPGNSSIDSVSRIARKAASLIEEGYLEDHNLTSVTDDTCHRTVLVRRKAKVYRGWISVANVPRRNSHSLTMSSGLLPVLSPVLARVRAIFDTNCDPVALANVKAEEIPVMAKRWQPWRSYATINLWNSLEGASNEQKS